jgi:uncharacterized membrane protein
MPSQLITPNLHAVLIHYPLGILIFGTFIELFSFLWPRSTFRAAGRWMILIGALSAIPATFSGIYALRSISRVPMESDAHWAEVKATSPVLSKPEVWATLKNHMLYQSIATGVATLVVLVWLGASDSARKSLRLLLLAILVWDMAVMIRAAHLGGQSVYKNGVAVEAVYPTTTESVRAASTMPVNWTNTPTKVEDLFPPLELHVTMAGFALAIAIAAIGLSFRKITATRHVADEPMVTGDFSSPPRGPRTPPTSVEMLRSFNPDLELELEPRPVVIPTARFWLLAFLLFLATFLGGVWVIARGADALADMRDHPAQIGRIVYGLVAPDVSADGKTRINYRKVVHAGTGIAIVALPIILAFLARFAPRQRLILCLFTLLLAAAVTVQVWVGVLMLYDTDQGKLMYLNVPEQVQ